MGANIKTAFGGSVPRWLSFMALVACCSYLGTLHKQVNSDHMQISEITQTLKRLHEDHNRLVSVAEKQAETQVQQAVVQARFSAIVERLERQLDHK